MNWHRSMSVLTLNMWNVNDPFKERMEVVDCFVAERAPDIVCLQEIPVFNGKPFFPSAFSRMGYNCVYLGSGRFGDRAEGIAICTKSPSILLGGVLLPEGHDNRGRTALAVGVPDEHGGWRALAVTTHLTNGDADIPVRRAEASEISRTISSIWSRFGRMPTVLTGDFNCTDDEDAIKLLVQSGAGVGLRDIQAEFGLAGHSTLDRHNIFAADHPRGDRRIDYIFMSEEWQLEDFQIVFNDVANAAFASDHYGLYVNVTLPQLSG